MIKPLPPRPGTIDWVENTPIVIKEECFVCPVGVACGTLQGKACEFNDRNWSKGAVIYHEGEPAKHAWYIKSGTVVLRRRNGPASGGHSAGQVREIRFVSNFIGLELLVTDVSSDTAIAADDVILCGITRKGLDSWVGPKTDPARTVLELSLRNQLTELTRRHHREGGAIQRAAAWLCDETPRLQTVALQRREIADLLSMRAETLSRVLARLCAMGAIAVGRSHVEITDMAALQAIARGEQRAH